MIKAGQKILKCAAIFLICVYTFNNSIAQPLSTNSKRAVKLFEEGRTQFGLLEYAQAKVSLEKAVSADENFLEAYMLLGDIHRTMKEYEDAARVYDRVISINAQKYPEVYYFSGLISFELQHYPLCIERLNRFLEIDRKNAARVREAEFYIASSQFAIQAMSNPISFQPVNLGKNINTADDEFINAISPDELYLYFTGRDPNQSATQSSDRFFYAYRDDENSVWPASQPVPPPLNTMTNQGALCLTHDGKYLLFVGCQWPDGYGSCDIYAARIINKQFGEPQNLGNPVNSSAWDSQPSLAPDGRTLYFSSTRQGGYGKSDIWKSILTDNGEWSIPDNLGENINTYGSEMAPYMHPDGRTLYFSSDRHPGMGGIDLFMSKMDENSQWSDPVNLGYPINTPGDEINIIVNARGDIAYISAKLPGGTGGYDIYQFELHPAIRPEPSTYIKGVVADAKSGKKLSAGFSLININTGAEVVQSFSDEKTGEFLLCLPTNRDYALNVSKEGYLFHSEHFSLAGYNDVSRPFLLDIALNPILPGEISVMRNIFFDTRKADLKEESLVELGMILQFLNQNPSIKVEISGHTDNIGTAVFNLNLSEQRAKAVVDYLTSQGIDAGRLQYKGYGFNQPVTSNETEEVRATNRRTEIKILEVAR